MITIISQKVNAAEAQNSVHWAFVLHPPVLQAVTWKSPSMSIFTNDSVLVGGHSIGHRVPTFTNYNFTGQAVALPICLGNLPYCVPLTPIRKSACCGMVLSFLIKKQNFLALMPLSYIMLHIGLTFSAVMTNEIPGIPIREPHGNNVYLLLQWLLMLQSCVLVLLWHF
jgi:hypothetical protein